MDQHHAFLKTSLLRFGIPVSSFKQAWETIKRVWASKFNERPLLSQVDYMKVGYMAEMQQRDEDNKDELFAIIVPKKWSNNKDPDDGSSCSVM